MKANWKVLKNHEEASLYAAGLVAEAFVQKPDMTVTFAAGDTPFACYRELIRRQSAGELTLCKARYIGLDEWVGLGRETEGSCIAAMSSGYYLPAGIPNERITVFDGLTHDLETELTKMQEALGQHPLELAILGVGVNGHVGFNEPGAVMTGDFSLVPISQSTQAVGRKYFAGEQTPTLGASITVQALQQAGRIVIVATGESKQAAVQDIITGRAELPAAAFLNHPGTVYVFDEAAVGEGL